MISVIKGDIIDSRKITDQNLWLKPVKELLSHWGKTPQKWEIVWGDSFQIEIADPGEALLKALLIKTLIKQITQPGKLQQTGPIDVKMSIGIGEKSYSGKRISESNGPAFIYAAEKFEALEKDNVTCGIKSHHADFDEEINLYLKLSGLFMDRWTISSAQLMGMVLKNPNLTQEEIGKIIGIKQSAVSGRWNRAHVSEVLAIEKIFRKRLKTILP